MTVRKPRKTNKQKYQIGNTEVSKSEYKGELGGAGGGGSAGGKRTEKSRTATRKSEEPAKERMREEHKANIKESEDLRTELASKKETEKTNIKNEILKKGAGLIGGFGTSTAPNEEEAVTTGETKSLKGDTKGVIKQALVGRLNVKDPTTGKTSEVLGVGVGIGGGAQISEIVGTGTYNTIASGLATNQITKSLIGNAGKIIFGSGIATWLASDNIISGMNFLSKSVVDNVQFNGLPPTEGLAKLDEAQQFVDTARTFVNVNTLLNPALWAFRGIFMTNAEAAQFSLDNKKEEINNIALNQQVETELQGGVANE